MSRDGGGGEMGEDGDDDDGRGREGGNEEEMRLGGSWVERKFKFPMLLKPGYPPIPRLSPPPLDPRPPFPPSP